MNMAGKENCNPNCPVKEEINLGRVIYYLQILTNTYKSVEQESYSSFRGFLIPRF